jgi:hypothetical protein
MRKMHDSGAIGRRLLSALVSLGLMYGSAAGAQAGTAPGQSVPDLTGDWNLTSGGTPGVVHIHATNSSGAFPTLTNLDQGLRGEAPLVRHIADYRLR